MYNQRDIVLIPFPYSDLTGIKQRPALIISNDRINRTEDKICCLITSNEPKQGVLISPKHLEKGSLPFTSWVKPQRIFTFHERVARKKLCTVTREFHDKIVSELNEFLKTES